jgi:D-sedoheptulose 7-phosphate isomerase
MNQVERIFRETAGKPAEFAAGYFKHVADLLLKLDVQAVGRFIEVILDTREKGRSMYFFGNGGSAATASHFANDFAVGTRSLEKPFRAFSLSDNISGLTATGNDHGFEEIFYRQLANCALKDGDLVVAISASGNSPNIIKAVDYANGRGAFTVGLTGFDGGKLKKISKLSLHVPTEKGEYGPVEDIHMIFDHVSQNFICAALRAAELQT